MENITRPIQRIYQFIDYVKLNPNKFSQIIGVSNSYLGKMLRKSGSIGDEVIENILRKYPEINPDWLLSGKGTMLRTELPKPGIIETLQLDVEQLKKEVAELQNKIRLDAVFYSTEREETTLMAAEDTIPYDEKKKKGKGK